MPTHTDNLQSGNIITDSTLTIDTVNQVTGINPEAILSYIPVSHDISSQADGSKKEFDLNPAVQQGTQNLFHLFLDGQLLTRATTAGDPDYFIVSTRNRIELGTGLNAPAVGAQLIAVYVEDNSII